MVPVQRQVSGQQQLMLAMHSIKIKSYQNKKKGKTSNIKVEFAFINYRSNDCVDVDNLQEWQLSG